MAMLHSPAMLLHYSTYTYEVSFARLLRLIELLCGTIVLYLRLAAALPKRWWLAVLQ